MTNFGEDINDRDPMLWELASRARRPEYMIDLGYLPDPDPVLAKLGEPLTVYKNLLTDPHVWACIQSRKSGTLSQEWEIRKPAGPVRASKAVHEAVEAMLQGLDMYQMFADILEAPLFGMSPIEVVWQAGKPAPQLGQRTDWPGAGNASNGNGNGNAWLDRGYAPQRNGDRWGRPPDLPLQAGKPAPQAHWTPALVAGKPPEWFGFDLENRLRFFSLDNQIEGELMPEALKFILPRHHASYANPYGERLLSRCFWPVAFKKAGLKFWAIFTEKYGMPWAVGKVPTGASDAERSALLTNLGAMVQDAVAVISEDEAVDIREASGKGASAEIYERLIRSCNAEISKAILGQTLSTEIGDKGSYAAASAHMDVRADLVDQDKRLAAESVQTLIDWFVALNFPNAEPPEFVFFEEEDLQTERAERDEKLSGMGVVFNKAYFVRRYGFEEDEIEVVDQRPVPVASDQNGPAPATDQSTLTTGTAFSEAAWLSADEIPPAPSAQKALDRIVRQAAAEVSKADSLEDVAENLFGVYKKLSFSGLEEQIGRAVAMAWAEGYGGATVEAGGSGDAPAFAEPAGFRFDMPMREALEYLENKGMRVTYDSWKDLWQEAHAASFTVARVTSMDVLLTIFDHVVQAIDTGMSMRDFRESLLPRLERAGWMAPPDEAAVDATGRKRLTGSRLDTIWRTNISAAHNVGRYKQLKEMAPRRPYWQYMTVDDPSTRPAHAAHDHKIYRYDHPFWGRWYPPNGFNCRCYVRSLTEAQMLRHNLRAENEMPAGHPDEGWNYNPGEAGLAAYKPDLGKYPPAARAELEKALR